LIDGESIQKDAKRERQAERRAKKHHKEHAVEGHDDGRGLMGAAWDMAKGAAVLVGAANDSGEDTEDDTVRSSVYRVYNANGPSLF